MTTKRILILANSRKHSGRCVAGKEMGQGGFGAWVRPISSRQSEEISELDRRYEDGTTAQLLDIVEIPTLQAKPHAYQSENHLIDELSYWQKAGVGTWADVCHAVDAVPGPLWINDHSSYNGINDEVPIALAAGLQTSLFLVRPQDLQIEVGVEGYREKKRKVRGRFLLNGATYRLMVTDPQAERTYLNLPDGIYPIQDACLCISLGEVYNGAAYKLIAAIFTPP